MPTRRSFAVSVLAVTFGGLPLPRPDQAYRPPPDNLVIPGTRPAAPRQQTQNIVQQAASQLMNEMNAVQYTWLSTQAIFYAVPGAWILANAGGGNISIYMPASWEVDGSALIYIKRVDSAGNVVNVFPAPGTTETVHDLNPFVLSQQGQGVRMLPQLGVGWVTR